MVKKCMIALAVAALMAATVQAGAPAPGGSIKRDGDWPWTYKAIDLCVMPIYMDVGHFVQLKDCADRELNLKQVTCTSIGKNNTDDFPCYRDCEEIKVRANFPAILGGRVDKNSTGILKDTEVKWAGDKFQINGIGDWETLTICVNAWNAEIWRATGPSEKTQVGTLTITVKPPDGGTP